MSVTPSPNNPGSRPQTFFGTGPPNSTTNLEKKKIAPVSSPTGFPNAFLSHYFHSFSHFQNVFFDSFFQAHFQHAFFAFFTMHFQHFFFTCASHVFVFLRAK